ncbi:MAG: hypothetical protein BWY72_01233 [Bacteroidetes bacterium ADurb.Bin416]|nr:MAG: hypothetical protein BWY72_01233 [Bacteroidetes bacterium ADurb.Bin416]
MTSRFSFLYLVPFLGFEVSLAKVSLTCLDTSSLLISVRNTGFLSLDR